MNAFKRAADEKEFPKFHQKNQIEQREDKELRIWSYGAAHQRITEKLSTGLNRETLSVDEWSSLTAVALVQSPPTPMTPTAISGRSNTDQ